MLSPRAPSEAPSRPPGFAVRFRTRLWTEVEDAVAARTLPELVRAEELLEQHRLQPDVACAAGAVARPREGSALALTDHLVAAVEVRLDLRDDQLALRLLADQ